MIREVIAAAWAESPGGTVAAIALTPVAVVAIWFLTCMALLALGEVMPAAS